MKRRSNTTRQAKYRPRPNRQLEQRLKTAGYTAVAGVDEAGRGPLAGPVVASAVILRAARFAHEINDSKRLTPAKREAAYREIMRKAAVAVAIVDHATIDSINILEATRAAMAEAVKRLPERPDYVLVDGNRGFNAPCPVRPVVRGDGRSLSIAAASIVAKVTRDRLMDAFDRLYPQYGFRIHKGYPTASHKAALGRHGPSPIHRRTFRPVRDVLPTV